jgi:hypothetical protein
VSRAFLNRLDKAEGKKKCSRFSVQYIFYELGRIINYTSLHSNPTANKEVLGTLMYANPAVNIVLWSAQC